MKLPIWALNKETGKYEVFPFHLLDDLSDGSKGLAFYPWRENYTRQELFAKYRDYFVSNPLYHAPKDSQRKGYAWGYKLKDQG
jgi:hypothetical protein